ncbi:MAG: ImmA/IrrE family metallo-endopeptidase [bacterium]
MRIFNKYGSKERLFEVFQRVNGVILNEEVLPKEKRQEIIEEFVQYCTNELGLESTPELEISYDNKDAQDMRSYGLYTPNENKLMVVAVNRNLGDILRTIAHELVHHRQFLDNKLTQDSNKTGSEQENEANAMAGVLMRNFGKLTPDIYE